MTLDTAIQTISHLTSAMNALGITMGDLFGAGALIITGIRYLREGKYKQLKAMLRKEAIKIADKGMSDIDRVQHLVDFAQSKSKLLSAIPDKMLIDAVNAIYSGHIKALADKENVKAAKAKAKAESKKVKANE